MLHADQEQTRQPARRTEFAAVALPSPELFADITVANKATLRSRSGMRGALNKLGFRLGLSPSEQRAEERHDRIRRQLVTQYQIAVVSVKGGVGRTTTVAALGSTFADLRPDRVVAVDASPHFGDLATRTRRHPYGLSLRDLAYARERESFSAVQSYLSINSADLAVAASPWTAESTTALTERDFAAAADILRRHYSLLLVDCGTGVLDSVTREVLNCSNAAVIVTPATVGGVTGAVATLNWLGAHGFDHLVARSVVTIVQHQPVKSNVDVGAIEDLFATAQRPTCVLPFDTHLAEGGAIDLRLLGKTTRIAFENLAATLADEFPDFIVAGGAAHDMGGSWR
ncbi:MinD/ParA family protein [Nocardia iowensis]|uniref:MinD/ParA family protein n=1 Tax=Nocardia iowensis TaxID=204891 RepID=A0ABX8RYR0_NOCIO|nr:MinD/ParA family protein [Nocardia iowensis]